MFRGFGGGEGNASAVGFSGMEMPYGPFWDSKGSYMVPEHGPLKGDPLHTPYIPLNPKP